jgi:sugar lactone lactonase YvrE
LELNVNNWRSIKFVVACSVLLAAMIDARSQPVPINTLAGQTTPGSANGVGYNAKFSNPRGMAVDASGNVYVADTQNGTIRKITPSGSVSTFSGVAGVIGSQNGVGTNAQFYAPQGLAADNSGNIYVADSANAIIRKINPAGAVSTLAGVATNFNSLDGAGVNARFYQPEALTVDGAGNVYVADTWNHTIRKVTSGGSVSTLAGLAGYYGCADGTNNKARFNRPGGIAVDGAANLYVADSLNHTVRKITPAGLVSTIAGQHGVWGRVDGTNTTARFFEPRGIVVGPSGDLFVMDSGNQTLRKISPSGTNWIVTTIAGLSGNAGDIDGTGNAAQFYFPSGLAKDSSGQLYVADSANNSIRTTRFVPTVLQFSVSANQLIIAWPASAGGYVLEGSASVAPGSVWTPKTNGIVVVGDQFVVATPLTNASAFYRLHR